MLIDLHRQKDFKRMRASTYDKTGGNNDAVHIEAGQSHAVPVFTGSGIIKHIWLTACSNSPDIYHELELVMNFDNAYKPQVKVPIADFFLFGHGVLVDVNSEPIQVSHQPITHITESLVRGSLNCMFPMPFGESAEIEFRNKSDENITVYYYFDWEAHKRLSPPILHFNATLNEEETGLPADQLPVEHGTIDPNAVTLDTEENYTFLNVENYEGHYVGTGLSIECKPGQPGKWWEGDDMFVIDKEPWAPRLHGTGTEDYFNLAWGYRRVDCRPEYGVTYLDKDESDKNQIDGRFSMYRFHLNDPIPFNSALHASIEHGHGNDCAAYYRSVAYWYGRPLA